MLVLLYAIIVNAAALRFMHADKSRAERRRRRISEKRLLGLAFVGGAFGIWAGMRMFRHKTKHVSFTFGVPVLMVWNLSVYYFLLSL
jgi:uncharacterized membrane protein YsdA (DUF1294 family)